MLNVEVDTVDDDLGSNESDEEDDDDDDSSDCCEDSVSDFEKKTLNGQHGWSLKHLVKVLRAILILLS